MYTQFLLGLLQSLIWNNLDFISGRNRQIKITGNKRVSKTLEMNWSFTKYKEDEIRIADTKW